jgi:hypothetical protein
MKVFRKLKILFFAAGVLCWTSNAFAQPVVSARTSARKITIGDHIHIWLGVKVPSARDSIRWPQFTDSMLDGLEWVSVGKIDTVQNKDSFFLKQELTLTGFDSGAYYIPSFPFYIRAGKQAPQVFYTDSFLVHVQTIAVDTTRPFKPIKDIVPVKSSWLDYWEIIVAVILLIALGIFIFYYFYKNKKTRSPEDKVPPERAHERALRLLEELKGKQLWQNGRVKEYYAELSYILRNYLENRFALPAMECTTDELLKSMKKDREIVPVRPAVKRVLKTSDLAKYAKAEPLPEEQEACMEAALQVIHKTKIKEGEEHEK